MNLAMDEDAIEFAVKRTGEFVESAAAGTRFTGDHINALCRAIGRMRLRENYERRNHVGSGRPRVDRMG